MTADFFGPQGYELVVEMAHDFRSPLSSILMLTESLLDGAPGELNAAQSQYLRLVYGAALGLAATTGDVMELATHAGQLCGAAPQRFFTADVIGRVRKKVGPLAREHRRDMRVDTPTDGERLGLPHAIGSVLTTLAVRAVRLGEAGEVRISARPAIDDPDHVRFSVRDSGTVIADGDLPSLFEPFAPPDSEKPNDFSALGMGLFVCRKVLREMGSALDIDRSARAGTTFSFTLFLPRTPGE